MKNYAGLNRFRYTFRNLKTGATSYFDEWCYGDIYQQIMRYKDNLKEMCLLNVSNDTHEIIKVVHLFNGDVVYEK